MWFSILKADGIGNWTNIYLGKEPYPSDETINSLDDSTSKQKARELDTTINRIETALQNIPEENPDLEDRNIATMRVFGAGREGRRSYVEPLGVEGATEELEKLKSYRNKFAVETTSQAEVKEQLQPLIDKAEQSKSFEDIMEVWKYINGITDGNWMRANQRWMRKLSDLVDTTDEFAKVINNTITDRNNYGYVEQVAKILGWGLKGERETIEVRGGKSSQRIDTDDPLSQPKQQKYVSTFTNNKTGKPIKILHEGKSKKAIEEAEKRALLQAGKEKDITYVGTEKGTKTEGVETKKKRRRTKPGTLQATRRTELFVEAVPVQNIELKIQNMKEVSKFRRFMDILHTSGATNNTNIEPFKVQGAEILHDVAIVAQRKLDMTLKLIDFGRKGLSFRYRQSSYRTEFAEFYLKSQIDKAPASVEIGPHTIEVDLTDLDEQELLENKKNEEKALGWIKQQIDDKKGEIFEQYKTYVNQSSRARVQARNLLRESQKTAQGKISQEKLEEIKRIYKENNISIGPGTVEFYLGRGDGSINYSDAISSFDIDLSKIFLANMWSWLFLQYSNSDSSAEFQEKVKVLSTTTGFKNYIPAGRTFQTLGEESFVDTMRVILTMIRIFYDDSFLDSYNQAIDKISKRFYINMEKAKDVLEEEEGFDDEEEQLELIIEGFLDDIDQTSFKENLMGCRDSLETIITELNRLLLNLDDKVHTELHDICREIGSDTEGKYTTNKVDLDGQPATAKEHLVRMGLLQELKGDEEE